MMHASPWGSTLSIDFPSSLAAFLITSSEAPTIVIQSHGMAAEKYLGLLKAGEPTARPFSGCFSLKFITKVV